MTYKVSSGTLNLCSLTHFTVLAVISMLFDKPLVRLELTLNSHVLFSRLCLAMHHRTYLTTYIWSRKGLDVACVRLLTDRVPRTHNTFGDRRFAVAGPNVWNSLPGHLRDENITYSSFRRELKTYRFSCNQDAM